MTNAQLKTILLPLKTKNDGTMPTWKQDILEAYEKWKHREPPTFNTQESVREVEASEDEEATDLDNDILEAMLALGRGVAVSV